MPEKLIGHRKVLDELFLKGLPPATLLLGPEGTGKWVLASVAAGEFSYVPADIYWNKGPLLAEHVRTVQAFCRTAALGPLGKLVMLCLDDAQQSVQNSLLKLLEEPPDGVKFLLTAGTPPLPTILSRTRVMRCGLLSAAEVEQVLLALGYTAPQASAAAFMAGGRVSTALRFTDVAEGVLDSVKAALKAAGARDPAALARSFRSPSGLWGTPHHELLRQWADEKFSGRWGLFSAQDVPGLSHEDAWYLITTMSALDGARPWLLDRAILENLAAQGSRL